MFSKYKAYKVQIKHPETGGGPAPAKPDYFDVFEQEFADDIRVAGIDVKNEAGKYF